MIADRGEDVVLALADRQLLRVRDLWHPGAAGGDPLLGALHVGADRLSDRLCVRGLLRPFDSPSQPMLVLRHQPGQARAELTEDTEIRYVSPLL
ncbi:hypothetical protein GCM10027610_140310 [Dactylosporangium cerinum]